MACENIGEIQKDCILRETILTLKVPENVQLYGLYVCYVVHICNFGMLRVNAIALVLKWWFSDLLLKYIHVALMVPNKKSLHQASGSGMELDNLIVSTHCDHWSSGRQKSKT